MAQSKINDLAGKFGKGGPPGLGIGLKLLAVGGALVYGLSKSVYTGKLVKHEPIVVQSDMDITSICLLEIIFYHFAMNIMHCVVAIITMDSFFFQN